MTFNAGERLSNTLMELKIQYKIDFEEVAKFMDIGYPMLTRYRKMEKFSRTVMHNIRYLEEMKVRGDNFKLNPKHYEDESEPRWLYNEGGEITRKDLMSEIQRISNLLERHIEISNKFYDRVLQKISPDEPKE